MTVVYLKSLCIDEGLFRTLYVIKNSLRFYVSYNQSKGKFLLSFLRIVIKFVSELLDLMYIHVFFFFF